MKLIPYERYQLITTLTKDEVLNRLNKKIEPKQVFRFSKLPNSVYEGSLNRKGFRLARIFAGNTRPIIIGEIKAEEDKTILTITIRLQIADYLFASVWFGTLLFVGVPISLFMIGLSAPLFIIFTMILFGYGMTIGNYLYERSHTKKFFAKLLNEES